MNTCVISTFKYLQRRHLSLPPSPWFPAGLSGPPAPAPEVSACPAPPPVPPPPDPAHWRAPRGTAVPISTAYQPLQAEDKIIAN